MDYKLAQRMNAIKASEIREILKLTALPGVISFAGGLPAPELFPIEGIKEASANVLTRVGRKALQYSTTEGDPGLRELVAERMNAKRGTNLSSEEILITSGSQQGLDMTGKLLIDEGDTIFCESPTYIGAISAFRIFGPRFIEIATDDDGLLPDKLEEQLDAQPDTKLIYVIPDFQNPSGRCWSLERRKAFMDVVARRDLLVIEDSPYSELRFAGEDLPSLMSMDTRGQVIFLGTFSKIFCPGLRIAWLAADSELVRRYVLIKQGTDLHTSTLSQLEVAEWLKTHDLDKQVGRIREVYKERRGVMLEAMDRCFPEGVSYTRPDGGLFLWVDMPEGCNAHELLELSIKRKVAFVPGGSFFPCGGHENTLRLNYSAMPPEKIKEGVEILAEVMSSYIESKRQTKV